MRNFVLGLALGLGIATGLTAWAQQSHSVSPYAPGNFMSDTLLYNRMLDADTDSYLRSSPRHQPVPGALWNPCP